MGPTNRHIGGVCAFFDTLGANNIVNTVVFAPRKPKTTVFTMFFLLLVARISVFMVFLCPCLAKTLVFTQVS